MRHLPLLKTMAVLLLTTTVLAVEPARAMAILDSTWAANGGTDQDKLAGFSSAEELANQDQFAASSVLYHVTTDEICSGTWIGNDEEHGYILTAAHCAFNDADGSFEANAAGKETALGAQLFFDEASVDIDGQSYKVTGGAAHPYYNLWSHFEGADIAVMQLDRPVEGIDEPAKLYCGDDEQGKTITLIGYGVRGIYSAQDEDPNAPYGIRIKTAAENVVDEVRNNSNEYSIDFDTDNPDQDADDANAHNPVSALEGVMLKGDSGGPDYMETDDGWAVMGVHSIGGAGWNNNPRLSTQRDFIMSVFPGATFVDGEGGDCSDSRHATAGIANIYSHSEFDDDANTATNYQDWIDGKLTEDDRDSQLQQAKDYKMAGEE